MVYQNENENAIIETECAEPPETACPSNEEALLREERRRFRWLSRIALLLALSPWLLPFFIAYMGSVRHNSAAFLPLRTIFPGLVMASLACGFIGVLLAFRILMKSKDEDSLAQRRRRLAKVAIALYLIPSTPFAGGAINSFLMSERSHEPRPLAEERNLRDIFGEVSQTVRANDRKLFPKLSSTPGRLMFEITDVYKSGFGMSPSPYIARRDPKYDDFEYNLDFDKTVDDSSFFYLGYRITNDQEMAAFASAYRNMIASGGNFEEDIVAPGGNGTNGDLVIPRLNTRPPALPENATRPPLPQNTARRIPIMIERIRNNRGKGAHVLYMDGHVEYLEYPGRWPMTRTTVDLLDELDRLGESRFTSPISGNRRTYGRAGV